MTLRLLSYLILWSLLSHQAVLCAVEYPYAPYRNGAMDPQLSGWPLTPAGEAYVMTPEYDRKPGREVLQHLPAMWPVTPTAGHWGAKEPNNRRYLDLHDRVVKQVQLNGGDIDLLLLGDSITQHWGGDVVDRAPLRAAWKRHVGNRRMINAGMGGLKMYDTMARMEEKIDKAEAEAEATYELSQTANGDDLKAKFDALQTVEADDALAALKARMGVAPAAVAPQPVVQEQQSLEEIERQIEAELAAKR